MRFRWALTVMAPLPVLAACGQAPVPAADVADAVATLLEQQVGVRPEVTCPDELPVEEDATTRCALTAGEDPTRYGVDVRIAAVEDGEPEYVVEVDREPLD